MGFKLPKLFGWVKVTCYPGMEMNCWLNFVDDGKLEVIGKEPWELPWYEMLGSIYQRLKVPAEMTDSGEEEVIELGTAKAVYELERMPGFDKGLLRRILGYLGVQRDELLAEERKN